MLAVLYRDGIGVPKNFDKVRRHASAALSWLRTTCEQQTSKKLPYALYALGKFHADGIGIQKDERKAFQLFQR